MRVVFTDTTGDRLSNSIRLGTHTSGIYGSPQAMIFGMAVFERYVLQILRQHSTFIDRSAYESSLATYVVDVADCIIALKTTVL